MDTKSAPEVARMLGVSLPTVHALFDAKGVPRTRRGVTRVAPMATVQEIRRERGTTPGSARIPPSTARVLAALTQAPFGLPSIRRVAELAGVSPTTASRHLQRLMDAGLVSHNARRVARGRAVDQAEYRIISRSPAWRELAPLVRAVEPGARNATSPSDKVPRRFWHLFWNSDPASLSVQSNGAYVARRMLNSDDAAAKQWALTHAAPADLRFAVSGRGADVKTKALVENWLAR